MTKERPGDWLDTYTNHKIWVLDPRPEEIYIKDIAHALSLMCRFNGLCSEFYSIGQHSILVSDNCPDELKLYGLLHDAAEAYVSDVPTPVKRCIPGFKEIEDGLLRAIYGKYGLGFPIPDAVKHIDRRVLHDEATKLMPGDKEWVDKRLGLGIDVVPMQPKEVEALFLQKFYQLTS